jgi:hypothetical protein
MCVCVCVGRQPELKRLLKLLKQVWTDPDWPIHTVIFADQNCDSTKLSKVHMYGSLLWIFMDVWSICLFRLYSNYMYYFSKPKSCYQKACCKSFGQSGGRDSGLRICIGIDNLIGQGITSKGYPDYTADVESCALTSGISVNVHVSALFPFGNRVNQET